MKKIMLFLGLLFFTLPIYAQNICNYWFLYLYNQYENPITFTLTNPPEGTLAAPTSGTIQPGSSTYIYIGTNQTSPNSSAGGLIIINDQSTGDKIGEINANASVYGNVCNFTSYFSLESGYKACGLTLNSRPTGPCTECISDEATATEMGEDGSGSTTSGSPAAVYTLCS